MTAIHMRPNKGRNITIWVLRVLIAAIFIPAAFMKLFGQPAMIHEFDTVGLGQWFRYFTALVELIGGIAILIPRVSAIGAIVLLLVDVGAFFAQILVLHMDFIHTLVFAAIIGLCIYVQREKLFGNGR